jgi:hypothetical protein
MRSTVQRWLAALGVALAVAGPGDGFAQTDLSGEWANQVHEDQIERGPGPEIGDFLGLPINEAGRLRGASWNPSLLTLPEHQCIPHPANYGPMHSNLRVWKDVEAGSQQVVAWHLLFESFNRFRTVYMDGRPHPSPDVPYTWQGFSTGRWVNGMLEITTTHMKAGRIRRNGIEHSDEATLVEYLAKHGEFLTYVSVLEDPAYLTEPYVHTRHFRLNSNQVIRPYPCRGVVEIDRRTGDVPHYLPGQNPYLAVFAERYGLPLEAALGGADTMYPEYVERMRALGADAILRPGAPRVEPRRR